MGNNLNFDITDVQKQIDNMNTELANIRDSYRRTAQDTFNGAVAKFFEATPEVRRIYWTQYTPYFNDGDECVFEVHDIYYDLHRGDTNEDGDEADDGEGDGFSHANEDDLIKKIAQLEAMLTLYPDGTLLTSVVTPGGLSKYYYVNDSYNWRHSDPERFSASKALQSKQRYVDELEQLLKEKEDFPNRKQILANVDAIKRFISSISDDIMQDMFGDHVKVVLTKDGSTVDEYDHD